MCLLNILYSLPEFRAKDKKIYQQLKFVKEFPLYI